MRKMSWKMSYMSWEDYFGETRSEMSSMMSDEMISGDEFDKMS